MQRLRGKLTYSNVVSSLCLVLLLGGGTAYAATQVLPKNSVGAKQIKPGAVTPAKLSKSARSSLAARVDPPGATGAQGIQGPPGERGKTGLTGPVEPLASGQSESGFYASGSGGGESGYIAQGITFRQPLAAPIAEGDAEWLKAGETSASCPGVGEAAVGHLCLYDNEEDELNLCCIYDNALDEPAADKNGFIVYWEPTGPEAYVSGEYTVTAP
jgi:hypothetical protein